MVNDKTPTEGYLMDNYAHLDINMTRLIRAEVAAALKDQVGESSHAPPSYDSSEPLLSSPSRPAFANDHFDTEAQQVETTLPNKSDKLATSNLTLKDCLRMAYFLTPIIAIVSGWVSLMATRVDPLNLSLLAVFLLFSFLGSLVLGLLVLGLLLDDQDRELNSAAAPCPPTNVKTPHNMNVAIFLSWSFSLLVLVFYAVIYLWARSPLSKEYHHSLIQMYLVMRDFQAKTDQPDLLWKLTDCLHDHFPGTNATTMEDFRVCLKSLEVVMA